MCDAIKKYRVAEVQQQLGGLSVLVGRPSTPMPGFNHFTLSELTAMEALLREVTIRLRPGGVDDD